LAERPFGLADGFLGAVDLDGVPAGDHPHAQAVPDQFQKLVPVAEQQDGLVAAVQGE
jgi:hypothetical protein